MSASAAILQPTHPHAGMDDELAALLLQLEEIDQVSQNSKGKNRIDQPLDFDAVYETFQSELEGYRNFLRDQKLAHSIGAAVHTDGALIQDLTTQDIQARNDHHLVLSLSSNNVNIAAPPRTVNTELQDNIEDWMSTFGQPVGPRSVFDFADDKTEAGPSMTPAERQADIIARFSAEFECMSCTDKFTRGKLVTTKCGHRYCTVCIRAYFAQSTKDATNFPPQCCQIPIPLRSVAKHMTPDELSAYHLAAAEFASTDRVYCCTPDCGMFIKPDLIHPGTQCATCPQCDTRTCAICRNSFHEGKDCPDDPSLRQTRELAQRSGWQTCANCKRVVQLGYGCNHMRCLCGHEFCYVCGIKWKGCRCETADIRRIEVRAEDALSLGPRTPAVEPMDDFNDLLGTPPPLIERRCLHNAGFVRVQSGLGYRGFDCPRCDSLNSAFLRCNTCSQDICERCRV